MFVSLENIMIGLDVLESISIITVAGVAIYGIKTWRRELIGKKKHDLAEEVLTLFYQARDVFYSIRNPMGYEGEGTSRKAGKNETWREKNVLDQAYVVMERFKDHQEVFNRLNVLRYKFMALFGKNKIKPFDELDAVLKDIIIASRQLAYMWQQQNLDFRNKSNLEKFHKEIRKYEAIFWAGLDNEDEIAKKVNSAIKGIEEICVPILGNK